MTEHEDEYAVRCPFCGSNNTFMDGTWPCFYATCPGCHAQGPQVRALPYDTYKSLERRAWDAFRIEVHIGFYPANDAVSTGRDDD